MGISKCNRLVRRLWDIVSQTRPSGCWRGYMKSLFSGQTLTHGQTKKVRACLTLNVPPFSRCAPTLVRIDLGINLLVLACGTSSICEDLLRGNKIKRRLGLAPHARNCACWHIILSKGNRPVAQSVGLFALMLIKV